MTYAEIVALLGYAGVHHRVVRITTTDRGEVLGVPTSMGRTVTTRDVFLRPPGAQDTEIAVALGAIVAVELA